LEKGRTPDEVDGMDILAYMQALAWKTAQDPVEDGYIDEVIF
jgi:hypothetical protein